MNKEIFKKIEEIEDSCYLNNTSVLVQELKKLLNPEKQEDEYKWICDGCSRKCKTVLNDIIPNYFCFVENQKTNWQLIIEEQVNKCNHNWVDINKMESTFKCTKCKETLCIKFYPEKQEHKCVCKECANWQERGRG